MHTRFAKTKAPSFLLRYGIALLSVAVTALLTLPLRRLNYSGIFPLFLIATIVSAWYGGLGPGLLATGLAALVTFFFHTNILLSTGTYSIEWLILFVLVSLLINSLDTARKRTAETLRESEDRYHDLVEHSYDLICTHDLGGELLSVNQTAARILGYDADSLVGRNLRDTLLPEFRGQFDDYIAEIQKEGIARGVMSIRTRDGEKRLWEYTNTLRTEGVDVPIVRGVAHDVTEQRRAEKALKASEAELRTLFAAMTDVILVLDAEGRYQKIAPTRYVYLYKPPDELIHKTVHEVLPRELADFLLAHIRRALDEGRMHRVEYGLQMGEKEVWFDGSVSPLSKDAVIWIARDITERKRAEEALRQAEEKYHSIFENAVEGIFQSTPEGQFITANPALACMLGYDSPEELLESRTDIARQHYVEPERRSEFKRLLEEHGIVREFEHQAYHKDGHKIWLSENVRAVRNDSDAVLYYEGFIEDINERKRAEEALRESHNLLHAVVEGTPDAVFVKDIQGCYQLINSAGARFLGRPAAEIVGKGDDEFFSPESAREIMQRDRQVMAVGDAQTFEETIMADGIWRTYLTTKDVYCDSQGKVIGLIGIARDITERKRAEEVLQTFPRRLIEVQEAERRRVARELHDEIGQALTAIKISLQNIDYPAHVAPRLNESFGLIDHALQQVRDLSFDLRPSLLDDLGLIAALRWYGDHEAQRAGLISEFVADLSETRLPPELETACFRITQEALTNVVRHAQAKRVWVELVQRGAELHLVIRDDGLGFNVRAVGKRRASKVNLGLQGMQERALILGGNITIKSAPARGTLLHVCFPLSSFHSGEEKSDS